MSYSDDDRSGVCYRHPDRQSYILCQRCGRTICPECQTEAAVGFHCPECMRESRASSVSSRPLLQAARRVRSGSTPVVTYSLIGVTIATYVLQLVSGGAVTTALLYFPPLTALEPWRMLSSVFVHSGSSIFHVLFNMLSLFIFGRILEQAIGRGRFLALYLISGFGGSVAVLLLNPTVGALGASGAIFGLLGAFFVLQRRLGGNTNQLVFFIVLNLAIGFVVPGISWQAHVGGLVSGAAVAFIYLRTAGPRRKTAQIAAVAGFAVLLVTITAAAFAVLS